MVGVGDGNDHIEEKDVHSDGWAGREEALAFIRASVEAYKG